MSRTDKLDAVVTRLRAELDLLDRLANFAVNGSDAEVMAEVPDLRLEVMAFAMTPRGQEAAATWLDIFGPTIAALHELFDDDGNLIDDDEHVDGVDGYEALEDTSRALHGARLAKDGFTVRLNAIFQFEPPSHSPHAVGF